jgi:hypothetical protein
MVARKAKFDSTALSQLNMAEMYTPGLSLASCLYIYPYIKLLNHTYRYTSSTCIVLPLYSTDSSRRGTKYIEASCATRVNGTYLGRDRTRDSP